MFSVGIAGDAVLDVAGERSFAAREVAAALYPWAVLVTAGFVLARRPSSARTVQTLLELVAYLVLLRVTGLRGRELAVAYLLAQFFIVARLLDRVMSWYRRPRRPSASATERIAVLASMTELLNIWAYAGLPGNWHLARTSYAMLWITSSYLHWRALSCRPSTPRTSQQPAS
jgi:hypothetical protein